MAETPKTHKKTRMRRQGKPRKQLEIRGTGHPGSRTFAIGDEDHTLGNPLRHVLMVGVRICVFGCFLCCAK